MVPQLRIHVSMSVLFMLIYVDKRRGGIVIIDGVNIADARIDRCQCRNVLPSLYAFLEGKKYTTAAGVSYLLYFPQSQRL